MLEDSDVGRLGSTHLQDVWDDLRGYARQLMEDRWVSLFAGLDSIRDCIAFPKNNSGSDVMLDAPARLEQKQLDELFLDIKPIQS